VLLTVDIGTSTFKAALFACDGTCLRLAAIPLGIVLGGDRGHEADPAAWLEAFHNALDRLGPLGETEALIISGNGPTLVPVTGEPGWTEGPGAPRLRLPAASARLWLDRRAGEESNAVSALAGGYVDPSFFLPKALWVRNHEPRLYEETRYFLSSPEFLAYALTGEARTIFPSRGFERWFWTADILAALDLDPARFPPFVFPGETIGEISAAAARAWGFPRGLQVIAGGPDFFVSILGTGVTSPGQACDRSGTSEGINLCTRERVMDGRLMSYAHPIDPCWNLSGIISTTGKAVAWARELLGIGDRRFDEFYRLAASAKAGSGGLVFLPYLAGERAPLWDPAARGVLAGLSLATGRGELARAVVEGAALAIRDVVAVMEECGCPVGELRITGGPAESGFFNQVKADVCGRPFLLPVQREAELLGLAIIGAVALKKYGTRKEAAEALVKIERTFAPREEYRSLYAGIFDRYRAAYRALKTQFREAAGGPGGIPADNPPTTPGGAETA
jgi:xylulokinase